jgi:hypothetical protein
VRLALIAGIAGWILGAIVSPSSRAEPLHPPADSTAIQLFAAVEVAWAASDAERLASLVDTTVVRIGLKRGAPTTAALTRSAAVFLFSDPLRLVETRAFRIVRLEVGRKGTARAVARWSGDWGGSQGARDVEVEFAASSAGGPWRLTEVRAKD